MGRRIIDDSDYDEFKVKVARHDKDGNDISGDKLGGGGRHREDGTLSAMAYDFEPLDSESSIDSEEAERIRNEAYAQAMEDCGEVEASIEAFTAVIELGSAIFHFLAENPEVTAAIGRGIKNGAAKLKEKTLEGINSVKNIGKKKTEHVSSKENPLPAETTTENDDTPGEKMTLEQAQAEYIELFKDFLRLKAHAQRLAKAQIVDANLERIDSNQLIDVMNSLSVKYPALLDESVQSTVFEMLDTVKNEQDRRAILSELKIQLE